LLPGLDSPAQVKITITDLQGKRIRMLVNEAQSAGQYSIGWDGKNHEGLSARSGIYFLKLESRGRIDQEKVILVK